MSQEPQSASSPDQQVELLSDQAVESDPSFEFLAHCYRKPLDRLNRSFDSGRPLAILIGEGRSASDFVMQTFLAALDEDTAVARISEPCVDATDLMRRVVDAAGFQSKELHLCDLESIFKMFLAFQKSHGRRTIICLENLQDSEWWVLDRIRRLVEMEVQGQFGLLVIVAGQPALKELLSTRPLSSISALAGYRISLAPFTLAETTECIRRRVESADSATTIGEVFQYQAITLIHELCAGVPDAIETLVSDSLGLAGREGVALVTTAQVKRAYEASRAAMPPQENDPDADTVVLSEVDQALRRLVVRLTGDEVREQALRQGHTLIGRSRLCDVRVESPLVSRHHALINYSGGGAILVDLGSTNGTYVDGYKVSAHELVAGESIRVGNCTIEYVVEDELQADFEKAARSAGIAIGTRNAKRN